VCFGQRLPGEAQDAEDDGQDCEAADLDLFAPQLVNGEDGQPVAWKGAGTDEYDLSCGCVEELLRLSRLSKPIDERREAEEKPRP
jgi:hypothetical protein